MILVHAATSNKFCALYKPVRRGERVKGARILKMRRVAQFDLAFSLLGAQWSYQSSNLASKKVAQHVISFNKFENIVSMKNRYTIYW
jgi:hypothetical protein